MKGKTIARFIDALYDNPEIEAQFRNIRFMVSGYLDADDNYTLRVDTIEKNSVQLFSLTSKSRQECVSVFENARIFCGLTIYEAEKEIEVLFG